MLVSIFKKNWMKLSHPIQRYCYFIALSASAAVTKWIVKVECNQYLNCKILHGRDAFAAVTNFTKGLVEMMYFRRRYWLKTNNKKKVFARNWSHFFPKSGEDQKKGLFRQEICRIFSPGWLFFFWSSSAQLSIGGHLNLDEGEAKSRWGDANSRWGDASNLQLKYWM